MKRILTMILACLTAGAIAAGTEHNAYAAVYDQVLEANADQALVSCTALRGSFAGSAKGRQQAFTALVADWAKVRASYILGGYDIATLDYPMMVDYFHTGKENIHHALARAIADNNQPDRALYKNSYKSLAALDDVLFSGAWSLRRKALATVITQRVCRTIAKIRDGYRSHRDAYLSEPDKALSLLINATIESVYATRDWRIGQVSGLTRQTLGKYLPQNLEYRYSGASWAVIGAILTTYDQLLGEDRQPNLATIVRTKGAEAGIETIQKALLRTIKAYHETPAEKAFDMRHMIPIFQGLQDIQQGFYRQLLGALDVTARIIDADGD